MYIYSVFSRGDSTDFAGTPHSISTPISSALPHSSPGQPEKFATHTHTYCGVEEVDQHSQSNQTLANIIFMYVLSL